MNRLASELRKLDAEFAGRKTGLELAAEAITAADQLANQLEAAGLMADCVITSHEAIQAHVCVLCWSSYAELVDALIKSKRTIVAQYAGLLSGPPAVAIELADCPVVIHVRAPETACAAY